MQILENLISAFSVLRGSKLRTILTLLGITIGIAGVIAMMSFGAGAEKLMMAQIENIGGPSMFGVYRPGYVRKNDRWQRNNSPHFLEMRDLHDILADCPPLKSLPLKEVIPLTLKLRESTDGPTSAQQQRNTKPSDDGRLNTVDFLPIPTWTSGIRFVSSVPESGKSNLTGGIQSARKSALTIDALLLLVLWRAVVMDWNRAEVTTI